MITALLQKLKRGFTSKSDFAVRFHDQFGFVPGREDFYKVAFIHRSLEFEGETDIAGQDNERLEYLGDAILGSIISEVLFYKFPEADEGTLTKIRSDLVNRKNLNAWGKHIGIQHFIRYDKSLESNQQSSQSLYGNAFEALIGAIFLDKGYRFTRQYLKQTILDKLVNFSQLKAIDFNYKSKLIEWVQKEKRQVEFTLDDEYEDENKKMVFKVSAYLDGKKLGEAEAYRKKNAEQEASRKVLENLNLMEGEDESKLSS